VVGRTEDARWLAVRAPHLGYRTVWLPAPALVVDQVPTTVLELPVRECSTPEVTQ
jgi:hypothetical protein